jgi:hypothetical protein
VCEPETERVAARIANLAMASEPVATVEVARVFGQDDGAFTIVLSASAVDADGAVHAPRGGDAVAKAFAAAVRTSIAEGSAVRVRIPDEGLDDRSVQALAASLLDGLCLGLSRS